MPNPYLTRKREQFEAIRSTVTGLQERAATEQRDLTDEEVRSITEQGTAAKAIADEITMLTEQETRAQAVGALAASVTDGVQNEQQRGQAGQGAQNRGERLTGTTTTRDRDPGHYRSAEDGGRHGFFSDAYRSKYLNDTESATRLQEHNRAAITSTVGGAGLVAPHWLLERFQTLNYQKRAFANAVVNIPLDGDSRPMTLPFESAGADGAVGDQAAEGDAPADSNTYDTDTNTITPVPTFGEQVVTRQFLDQGTPAGDFLIYKNLSAIYDSKIEAKVCAAAVAAAASNAVTINADTGAAAGTNFGDAGVAQNAIIDTTTLIWGTRFQTPNLVVMTGPRFGKFRKLRDDANRPLMPVAAYGPQNADGLATGLMAGEFEGLTMLPTTGLGAGTAFPEKFLVVVTDDIWLFEDTEMQYRFEEKGGPEKITLGIWRYNAVKVVQGGLGVRTITVTEGVHAA